MYDKNTVNKTPHIKRMSTTPRLSSTQSPKFFQNPFFLFYTSFCTSIFPSSTASKNPPTLLENILSYQYYFLGESSKRKVGSLSESMGDCSRNHFHILL